MTQPFFSVVIPTKNRSFIIENAIKSVFRQSFGDFEIVIADNDETDATRKVIEGFQDPRIQYFRTGNLSMPDNWEFGISQAKGEYITVLTDRLAFRTRVALERVYTEVEKERYGAVSWRWAPVRDDYTVFLPTPPEGTGQAIRFSSEQLITDLLNGDLASFIKRAPIGLSSCVHHKVVNQIRNGEVGRICLPVSPDFTMAYLELACLDKILHIDDALVLSGGMRYSNGISARLKTKLGKNFIKQLGGDYSIVYNLVPVKASTIYNGIYNDYLNITKMVGGKLAKYSLNLSKYFIVIYEDIKSAQDAGVNMSEEWVAWHNALSEQDKYIQEAVKEELKTKENNISLKEKTVTKLLSIGRSLGFNQLWKPIKKLAFSTTNYNSLIEYIEATDKE